MFRLLRLLVVGALGLALTGGTAAATPTSDPTGVGGAAASEARVGRTVIVLEPDVYADFLAADVDITPIGKAKVAPYEDTLRITLPVDSVSGGTAHHSGGIRLTSPTAVLTVRDVAIPAGGFVSGAVRGSEVGDVGRTFLFLQADSSSPLGDTALRFTFTFASYVNRSFGTDFVELGFFGYATTRTR